MSRTRRFRKSAACMPGTARKTVLVEHGFRLPSALDNRPLNFEEFQALQGQTVYVSATPGEREMEWSKNKLLNWSCVRQA